MIKIWIEVKQKQIPKTKSMTNEEFIAMATEHGLLDKLRMNDNGRMRRHCGRRGVNLWHDVEYEKPYFLAGNIGGMVLVSPIARQRGYQNFSHWDGNGRNWQ